MASKGNVTLQSQLSDQYIQDNLETFDKWVSGDGNLFSPEQEQYILDHMEPSEDVLYRFSTPSNTNYGDEAYENEHDNLKIGDSVFFTGTLKSFSEDFSSFQEGVVEIFRNPRYRQLNNAPYNIFIAPKGTPMFSLDYYQEEYGQAERLVRGDGKGDGWLVKDIKTVNYYDFFDRKNTTHEKLRENEKVRLIYIEEA